MNKEELEALPNLNLTLKDIDSQLLSQNSKFTVSHKGYRFECLWQPSKKSSLKTIVFLSSGGREKGGKTFFHRWSHPQKCNVLNIEDPMYKLFPNLTTTWYYGNASHHLMDDVKEIIVQISQVVGSSNQDVVFAGSSAAGYASLLLACMLPGSACIAMNPQIVLKNWGKVADRLESVVGCDLTKKDPRNDLTTSCLSSSSHLLITVNSHSARDWDNQVKILWDQCFRDEPKDNGLYVFRDHLEFLVCTERLQYPHSCKLENSALYQAIDYIFGDLSTEALLYVFGKQIEAWKMSEAVLFADSWVHFLSNIPLGFYSIDQINKAVCALKKSHSDEVILLKLIRSKKIIEIESHDAVLTSIMEKEKHYPLVKFGKGRFRIDMNLFNVFFKNSMESSLHEDLILTPSVSHI